MILSERLENFQGHDRKALHSDFRVVFLSSSDQIYWLVLRVVEAVFIIIQTQRKAVASNDFFLLLFI